MKEKIEWVESASERWTKRTGISCPQVRTGNQAPKREIWTLTIAVLVEDLAAQGAEVPACSVGAAMCEEAEHHPALVDVRNFQGVCHSRARVGVVDQAVASSVVGVVLALGVGVALHQGGAEALGQGLVEQLDGG